MFTDRNIEEVCSKVMTMTKSQVKHRILHFDGPLRLDFTEDYLNTLDLDTLRHILMAALITTRKKQLSKTT